jgi:hypothetical protein
MYLYTLKKTDNYQAITTMKNIHQNIILVLFVLAMISCKTTTETTTENHATVNPQMQANNQEQNERKADRAAKSGLTQDDIQKMDDYAKRKAYLECKLKDLDDQASKALSDVAAKDFKTQIAATSDQFHALGKEIDAYLNTEPKQKYFYQVYKQYAGDCP